MLDVTTSGGARTLRFGEEYRVSPTPSLRAELDHILGPATLRTLARLTRCGGAGTPDLRVSFVSATLRRVTC